MCEATKQCEYVIGFTKTGKIWIPKFVDHLNQENCSGCGRCYKACPCQVFELTEHPGGDRLGGHKIMSIARPDDCIGDGICQTVCPKKNIICQPRPAKEKGEMPCLKLDTKSP